MLSKTLKIFAPAVVLASGTLGVYALVMAFNLDVVNWAALLGYPVLVGIVLMYFRPKGTLKTFGAVVAWLIGIMLLAVLGSYVSGMEGLICITMAIAPILIGTLLGGVVYLTYKRWQADTYGSLKMVALPLVALFFVSLSPPEPQIYTISNSVVIDAAPAQVFAMLKSIPDIAPEEVPTRLSHWLGVPKPTSAVWDASALETIRHSHWGEQVHFRERITTLEQDRRIAWEFEFPEGWIADGIEDPHVKVGGRYFDVLSGAYELAPVGNKTRLTLTTRTSDTSTLGAYAEFWHRFFFEDFHEVILSVVKTRIEARG